MGRKGNGNKKRTKGADKISSSNVTRSKYHGLENQGATCYLNSVLQVLFMTRDFRDAVSSSANADPNCIDGRLTTLFNTLKNKTAKTQEITDHLKIRRVSEQDDAAECFEKILSYSSPQASQIFQGQLIHRNTCSKCRTATWDEQPFWSLPLPLVDSDKDFCVTNGIKSFFEESNISGENQMYCNQCNVKADATIKAEMKQHPQVLALLMKRFKFEHSGMKYVKINRTVEIPVNLLIPHYEGQSENYELYASVQHSGDLRHGHYTVNIKPEDDEEWYKFSDTTVTPISQVDHKKRSFRSQNAYLLFYKKNTSTQDNSGVSTCEGPKNDNKDQTEQCAQDAKTGKRKVEEDVEAADSQKTDGIRRNTKRQKGFRGGTDSKAVPDENSATSISQNNREAGENHQSKQNHDSQSKKNISDKSICNPPVCPSEEQDGEEECKRGDNQELTGQPESRCYESKVDQDNGQLADANQHFSVVSTSEAPKHQAQDEKQQQKQDVKTGERMEDEEGGAADSRKTDKSKSKTKRKMAFQSNKDGKTPSENSCTSVTHKSGKQSSKNQHQNSEVRVQDDGRLKERNGPNPNPDGSHRRQTSFQISQKCHQRNSREAVDNQSKQNHEPESKKDISDKLICNPPACSSKEQDGEEEVCERGDDQVLTGQSESRCNQSEVDQDDGKLADVGQEMSEVCNLNISKQHEEESHEKKFVNITEEQDRGSCVEKQRDEEKMTDQYRTQSEHRESRQISKISLCNDQTQKKGENSVSINTSANSQEHKQVTSDSVDIRREHCGGSEGNQDNRKSDEVCPNKLWEDQEQKVNTQGVKGTNEDAEAKCDPRTDGMDTLSCCLKNLSLRDSSKEHRDKCMNGKAENNTEIRSLTESSAENIENVSLGPQTGVVTDQSHESDKRGRRNRKGQNKQKKSILHFGLASPMMKNTC